MTISAKATYYAIRNGASYLYAILLCNTSPAPYDIYSFLLGRPLNAPSADPFPLENIIFISSPPGWIQYLGTRGIVGQTSFQGNAPASGYILPGEFGKFVFQSSTRPPKNLPFGCSFYDNAIQWGFAFEGTADCVECVSLMELPILPRWLPLDRNVNVPFPDMGMAQQGKPPQQAGTK
jgi:hypothetical protein